MKIGDYVRTKCGISKIISNPNENEFNIDIFKKDGITLRCIKQKNIILSSPNIIELFEEHDLVVIEYFSLRYKERVTRLFEVDYKDKEFMTLKNAYCDFMLRNNEFNDEDKKLKPIIKSIVTKEQFSTMEYKVESKGE